MKKIIIGLVSCVITLGSNAQEFSHSGIIYDGNEVGIQNLEVQLHTRSISSYEITTPTYSNFNYAGGTSVNGCDDCVQGPFNIGFTFNYFGNNYTQFYVSSNGWIGFSPGQTNGYVAQFLPNGSAPKNAILANWEDLFPSSGQMNYFVTGVAPNRKMVFNFNAVPFFGCRTTVVTWQIVLNETSNIIDINLASKPQCGGSAATMGLTSITGNPVVPVGGKNAVQWSITQGTSYRFTPSTVQNEFVLNRSVYTNANGSFSFTSTGLDINNYQFKIIVPTPTTTSTTTQIDANHIIDLVLQRVPLTSKEYYRVDLNDDGIISVSDAFYSFGLFSGLKTNVGSLPSVRFFSQSEWNTIKFSTTNLKPSLPGQSSFTILSPIRNGSTTIYLLTTGFSNKNKLTY
jgi:hypothetical protein